jgi:pyruvate/2-oxoglutarate dehydrogenase complex dihydrolipoamide acyltransferase (E2) component
MVNARYLESNRIRILEESNIAIAVATESGLVAPVIRDAGALSLVEISKRLDGLVRKVREGTFGPDDLSDATFTISNLGALGAHRFTPMVVPGQSAILGVGAARPVPSVAADGAVEEKRVFTATLTADHRVLDGADAIRFLKDMRDALETQ